MTKRKYHFSKTNNDKNNNASYEDTKVVDKKYLIYNLDKDIKNVWKFISPIHFLSDIGFNIELMNDNYFVLL